MKNLLNKVFFVWLFLCWPVVVPAADVCRDRVYINITSDGNCGTPLTNCPTLPTGCTSQTLESSSCLSVVCNICCPDTENQLRGDVSGSQVIVDVPLGDEQSTAQTGFNVWASTHNYQDPPDGYLRTGTLEGFVYNTAQSDTPGTVDLNLTYWKRGFFTKSGDAEVIPIENLGEGGAEVVQQGVGDAIDEKFGTGLAAPWNTGARNDGKKPGGADYVPGSGFGTVKSLTESFAAFKTSMQGTVLFGLPSSFAAGAPGVGGTAPVMTISGGDTFGTHDVDFAFMSPWLVVLRGAIMLGFAFAALKIITLKGGGG